MRGLDRLPAPHLLALALCFGLAASLLSRPPRLALLLASGALAVTALVPRRPRTAVLVGALVAAGWWWGSARLDVLDRSVLVHEVGRSALARVEVTGPARKTDSRFAFPSE